MSKVDSIILAGAPAGPGFADDPSVSRAMVRVGAKTMLQWVVDALKGSQRLLGGSWRSAKSRRTGSTVLDAAGSDLVTNIRLGIEALGTTEPCADRELRHSAA